MVMNRILITLRGQTQTLDRKASITALEPESETRNRILSKFTE
jgi:hypothetical protein